MTIQETRTQGIGNGFKVLNPADGYRQDNRLWFGECSVCGERITNSALDGVWKHTQQLENGWSKQIDYCPKTK